MIEEHKSFLSQRYDGSRLIIGNGSDVERIIQNSETARTPDPFFNNISWVNKEKFDKEKEKFGETKESPYQRRVFGGIEAPSMQGEEGGYVFNYLEKLYFNFWAQLKKSPLDILEGSDFIPDADYLQAKHLFSRLEEKSENPRYFYIARTWLDNLSENFITIYGEDHVEEKGSYNPNRHVNYIGNLKIHRDTKVSDWDSWSSGVFMTCLSLGEGERDKDEIAHIDSVLNQRNCNIAFPEVKVGLFKKEGVKIHSTRSDVLHFSDTFKKYLQKRGLKVFSLKN